MRIEYVLIESQTKDQKIPNKKRIVGLLKKEFPQLTSTIIPIQGKRKIFNLDLKITSSLSTGDGTSDNIYNIVVQSTHSDKKKCAELLEIANKKIKEIVDKEARYHLIVAYDELSEYYCNRAYPKYQIFERQLRHLIFKAVTKSYGNLWTKETLSKELKDKIKDDIKSRGGTTKEDILIERALHEMSLTELINYLFYGQPEVEFGTYIDEFYTSQKIKGMSKEQLVALIEKGRRKSVWNLFLSNELDIEEPQRKLKYLKDNRNKVAHCKEFYIEDYTQSMEYLDLFIPKIENAINNVTIADPVITQDILLGFGNYAKELAQTAAIFGQAIAPAIKTMAEIGASVAAALRSDVITGIAEIIQSFSPIDFSLPSSSISPNNYITPLNYTPPILGTGPIWNDPKNDDALYLFNPPSVSDSSSVDDRNDDIDNKSDNAKDKSKTEEND